MQMKKNKRGDNMKGTVKIYFGFWEATLLAANTVIFKLLLIYPVLLIKTSQTAAILICVALSLVAIGLFAIVAALAKSFRNMNLLQIAENYLGRIGLAITGLLLAAFFLYSCSVTLKQIVEGMKTVTFRKSPPLYISMFFVIAMALAVYIGLKSVIRLHAILAPVVLLCLGFIFISSFASFDYSYMFPLFGSGIPSFMDSAIHLGLFGDIVILFLIMSRLEDGVSVMRVGITSLGIIGVFMLLTVGMYALTVPYEQSTQFLLPLYQMERFSRFGNFTLRLEFLYTLVWSLAYFLNLSTQFYGLCFCFSHAFKAKSYKPAIIPLAAAVLLGSYLPRTTADLFTATEYLSYGGIAAAFVIPTLVLILARIVKGMEGKSR